MDLVSSHNSFRPLIFVFFSWAGFASFFDGNVESMDGWAEREGREGGRVDFFGGCSVRGIVNSKIPYSSFTGE